MWIFTIGNRVEFHATGDTRIGCVYAGAVSTTPHRDFIHTHTNANRFVLLNLTLSRVRRYSTDTSTSRSCPHTHSLTTTRLHVRILTTSTQASNRRTIVGSSRVSSAGFCQWWISIKTKRIASNSRNRFCHFVLFFLFIYFVRSPVVKTRSKPKKKKEKGKISFQRILTVFIVSVVANKKSSQLVRTRFCMGLAWRCVQILYLGSRVLFSSLFFSPTIFLSLSLYHCCFQRLPAKRSQLIYWKKKTQRKIASENTSTEGNRVKITRYYEFCCLLRLRKSGDATQQWSNNSYVVRSTLCRSDQSHSKRGQANKTKKKRNNRIRFGVVATRGGGSYWIGVDCTNTIAYSTSFASFSFLICAAI